MRIPLVTPAHGDDNGFTVNAGVGAKYFITDNVSLRLDARYRYLDKVVDRYDDFLNMFETTFGIGFQFQAGSGGRRDVLSRRYRFIRAVTDFLESRTARAEPFGVSTRSLR